MFWEDDWKILFIYHFTDLSVKGDSVNLAILIFCYLVNPLNIQANVHFQLKNVCIISLVIILDPFALYYHGIFKQALYFSPVD